jgi:hypothetical protein
MFNTNFYNNNNITENINNHSINKIYNINKLELKIFELLKENYLINIEQLKSHQLEIKNKTKSKNTSTGRRKNEEKLLGKIPKHSRKSHDNLFRKIKVLYHNFIINFLNNYILKIFGSQRLLLRKISGNVTKNISKNYSRNIAKKTIKEFIESSEISSKYIKDTNLNKNRKYCDRLCLLNNEIKKILNTNYVTFYKNFFLCKNKKFLIEKYGLKENKTKNLFIFIEKQNLLCKNNEEEKNYLNLLKKSATEKFPKFLNENEEEENIFDIIKEKNEKIEEKTKENSQYKTSFSDDVDSNERKNEIKNEKNFLFKVNKKIN